MTHVSVYYLLYKRVILFFLLLSFVSMPGNSECDELPTEHGVKYAVQKILDWRKEYVKVEGAETTWHSLICYLVATQFAQEMKKAGFKPVLSLGRNHLTISVYAIDNRGRNIELVIDPTYRQFYTAPEAEILKCLEPQVRFFRFFNIPEILVERREDVEKRLKSFPLKLSRTFIYKINYKPLVTIPVLTTEDETKDILAAAMNLRKNRYADLDENPVTIHPMDTVAQKLVTRE